MAFWDNLGQKATVTTAKAVQKAKDISDVAKFNSMISEEDTRINNIYYEVGKLYIALHEHSCEDEFKELITSFQDANQKIEMYKKQIEDIKGIQKCEKCGAEIPVGAAFCSSCGASIPKPQPVIVEQGMKCEKCGADIKEGDKFCTSCGSPVAVAKKEEPVEIEKKICPSCGAKLDDDCSFCVECGTKLNN